MGDLMLYVAIKVPDVNMTIFGFCQHLAPFKKKCWDDDITRPSCNDVTSLYPRLGEHLQVKSSLSYITDLYDKF